MANTPSVKTYEQILGDMLSTYMGKIGVNDLNVGGAMISFFEAFAQAVYRSTGDVFSILRDYSVDRASGEALKRIADEENVKLPSASVATGKVTISDTSFSKISTKVYAGSNPPAIGTQIIKASDASLFPSTGAIYIGRGTSNIEGPISYSSTVKVGSYYEINLSTPTVKYHNISESVILSQGGVRKISLGTVVKTKTTGSSSVVSFTTSQAAIILDGETEIANVPVAAQEPGKAGNVPSGAISEFESEPFSGAAVTNLSAFSTGTADPTDDEIKAAIKQARMSKGLGTATAIKYKVSGAQAKDESATVVSNEILNDGETTTLYIDNGSGYEEKTKGVGLEYLVDSAIGGEKNFQLATGGSQTSVAKAFLQSTFSAPFSIIATDSLAILVGGIVSEHTFSAGDFVTDGYATAYEVVSSINANSSLNFEAQTVDNGNKVIITSKSENYEYLQITTPSTGNDVAVALGFPSNEVQTLRLYKNRQVLTRNGRFAQIESAEQDNWVSSIATGDTLIVKVDKTSYITYAFTDADFITEGTYTTVNRTNSLTAWMNVINSKIIGITASINGTALVITSNLGTSSRAQIIIDPASTLVTKGMFTSLLGLSSTGQVSDYTLSRNIAQLKLRTALSSGDSLTSGTQFSQGFVQSSPILGGIVSLATNAHVWVAVDDNSISKINHGVASDTIVHFEKKLLNIVRIRSAVANAFVNAQVGDYVILWSEEFNTVNRLEGRIFSVGTDTLANDYIELKLTSTEYALTVNEATIVFSEGLEIFRINSIPQKLSIAAGTYDINTIADGLNNTLIGAVVTADNDEYLTITTNTKATNGSIYVLAIDNSAKSLNFTAFNSGNSITSHYAFYESLNSDNDFPAFIHGAIADEQYADTPSAYIAQFESDINLETLVDPNSKIEFLHPYLNTSTYIDDCQAKSATVQASDLNTVTVGINTNPLIRRLRIGDRFCVLKPYDLSYADQVVTILNDDAVNNTFAIPLYRKAKTNTTESVNPNSFRAYDVDSGSTVEFNQYFNTLNFSNYKVFMKAKNVIDPIGLTTQDAILYRSILWGTAGEKYNIGYTYPTAANSEISHVLSIQSLINVRISLKSGAAVANTIDGTTQWDITVLNNTPVAGVETATYTWNGVGSNPNMGGLVVGNYVTINNKGDFNAANIGTFKISAASSGSFSVHRPNGLTVAESNVATIETGVVSLYAHSATTAQEIVDYVTSKLSNYLTAVIVNDSGTTGSGVISESTYENNSFSSGTEGVSLVDGINWIQSVNLAAVAPNPQFNLKTSLALSFFNTSSVNAYAFNNGEDLYFVPTTAQQIKELISILSVSGFSTVGEVLTSEKEANLQLATNILGSSGALQVTGGSGNNVSTDILGVASVISGTDLFMVNIAKTSSSGLHGDQYVKLQASNYQKKESGISLTTNVSITPNVPTAGYSTIVLGNREASDRYFGQPRNYVRDHNRVFHVEKHGGLVCISWNGAGSNPVFTKVVETNADTGNMSVTYDTVTGLTNYVAVSGSRNFCEIASGDSVVIQNFSDDGNNGVFEVMGVSENGKTLSVDNPNGVTAVSAATTASDLVVYSSVKEGDSLIITAPFNAINQGTYRIIRKFDNSIYIKNDSALEEVVEIVDNYRVVTFDSSTQFNISVSGDMAVAWNSSGTQPNFSSLKMGDIVTLGSAFNASNQGSFMVTGVAATSFNCANAKAVVETGVQVTNTGADVLNFHIPSLSFSDYENAIPSDYFVITGSVLGSTNVGSFAISQIINRNTAVVSKIMTTQVNVPLSNDFGQVYIREANFYVGYKKIHTILINESNNNNVICVLESINQVSKINEDDGGISITAVGKLGFSTNIINGLDSYRYHTGLIAEANRIVYGDPRDSTSYPGVAAAGAEIFIKGPLIKRIVISINVRVKTGIAFNKIAQQVRNNVSALVNSSAIGQSIAISDIIAAVNRIPGTRAVSITSPTYNSANDLIVVNASEKPKILDTINDILVSKITD